MYMFADSAERKMRPLQIPRIIMLNSRDYRVGSDGATLRDSSTVKYAQGGNIFFSI